jgi:hypothetical protein
MRPFEPGSNGVSLSNQVSPVGPFVDYEAAETLPFPYPSPPRSPNFPGAGFPKDHWNPSLEYPGMPSQRTQRRSERPGSRACHEPYPEPVRNDPSIRAREQSQSQSASSTQTTTLANPNLHLTHENVVDHIHTPNVDVDESVIDYIRMVVWVISSRVIYQPEYILTHAEFAIFNWYRVFFPQELSHQHAFLDLLTPQLIDQYWTYGAHLPRRRN